jgi:hypothetical protein
MPEPRKKESYSVFVKFRRTRLTMRRGIACIEDAVALAAELRAERFHNPGDVFVVKEPDGEIVDEALVPVSGVRSVRAPRSDDAAPEPLPETVRSILPIPEAALPDPAPPPSVPPPSSVLSRPTLPSSLPEPASAPIALPALGDRIARASSVAARARRAGERFAAAIGAEPPPFPAEPSLLDRAQQSRRRARLLCDETSRAARAFADVLGRLGPRRIARG